MCVIGVCVACQPEESTLPTNTPVVETTCVTPSPEVNAGADQPTETPRPTLTPTPLPSDTPTPLPPDTPTPDEPTHTPRPTINASPTPAPTVNVGQGEILFSVYPYGAIGTMSADGSGYRVLLNMPRTLAINNNRHASWLPDGSGISYTVDDFGQAEIWVMDSQGGDQRFLLGEVATDSAHSWSPDGASLVFVSAQNRIALYNLADQTVAQLTDGHFRSEGDPDWSPDGSRITFAAAEGGNQDIYIISVDGTDLVRLTSHPDVDQQPDWSPDGSKIAFSSTRDGDHIKDIFVIDLGLGTEQEGNIPVQLTFEDTLDIDPDWSPDGASLVYAAHTFGGSHATLFAVAVGGGPRRQLTEENTYHSPQWRPR